MTLTTNWVFRIILSLLMGLAVAASFRGEWRYEQQVAETGCTVREGKKRDTVIWLSPWVLPFLILTLWLVTLLSSGPAVSTAILLEGTSRLAVLLTLYFVVLLVLLPLLRKTISARACATLWLLPVFVYYGQYVYQGTVPPLVVLRIPRPLAAIFAGLWLSGFLVVLLWHLISHLRFRRMLLKEARPVEDQQVKDLWWEEERLVLLKRPLPLLVSPAISSPLTIGLFGRTMCTVLPERDYTLEQYRLIFRHELRHVQRRDVDTKCFYLFCKALCWFNPLVWVAVRKASADLELSCDEMVVYGAEDRTRREYASLLLETAGDERGFTTCLSASARGLRHRLEGVIRPQKRFSGTLVVGVITVALVLCSAVLSVSSSYGTLGELLLVPHGAVTIDSVLLETDNTYLYRDDLSPQVREELMEYLSALPVTKLATGPDLPEGEPKHLALFLADRKFYLELTPGLCALTPMNTPFTPVLCRLDQPVDWDGLYALMEEKSA